MSIPIGLDTTFIAGTLDVEDMWHARTLELQVALEAHGFEPVIFDCVLAEVVSILARRVHEKRRAAQLATLLAQLKIQFPTKSIVWLYPDLPKVYEDVVALVEQSSGELNFNDALIALACRDRGIEYLASFDADFDHVNWLKRISRPDQF
ncbi:MAG TPA: type II toxin-antitoxin system VapC family toxin [Anaerolineae bacterium]|nr:type II toxin-antitoxin system VapC family toxin [Anaerolineae bacterium]